MTFVKPRIFQIFFILLMIAPAFFAITHLESNSVSYSSHIIRNQSRIKLSQSESENITIESEISKFSWIEGILQVSFSANISGYLKITFADSKGGAYFRTVNNIVELKDDEENEIIKITIKPQLTTFPGEYEVWLFISYFEKENKEEDADQIYTKEFKLVLGIGYVFLLSAGIIFSTAILLILVKKESIKEEKKAPSGTSSVNLPVGKIKCPECSKIIDEGLSFCPECGNRIPEFLRFGPKPSS